MDMTEKKISGTRVYEGRVIQLDVDTVSLPNGKTAKREIARHCGGVGILPITENGEVILVRQFRYAFEREILEIPAGKMDVGGEAPLQSALRELKEETGCTAEKVVKLGDTLPSPGCFTEVLYLFLATGLKEGAPKPDEDEFLELVRMPFDEALRMVMENKIQDAKSVMAILMAARILGK